MSRIRSKNTTGEKIVFAHLRNNQIYFQKHYKRAPGNPDIALPRKKLAVFIDGEFWHGKTFARLLETRGENDYWTVKIKRNMERDKKVNEMLTTSGWKILRIWESDLKRKRTKVKYLIKIENFLEQDIIKL